MSTLNTARAILVGGAAIAALIAAAYQEWAVVAILAVGLAAHAGLWVWLYRGKPLPAPSPGAEPPPPGGDASEL